MKKLQLNKKTIASLSKDSLQSIKGGGVDNRTEPGPRSQDCSPCPPSVMCYTTICATAACVTAGCPGTYPG